MKRRIRSNRPVSWQNPLKDFSPRPYLDDPVFPTERWGPVAADAMKVLERYYTPERLNTEVDARALENFVKNPGKHVFVIWGDIGIGKTWFVRYHLEMLVRKKPGSLFYGIVDMLRASPTDAQEKLQQQIIKILEDYLFDVFGNLENGLRPYCELSAIRRFGRDHKESAEFQLEIKRAVNEVLAERDARRAEHLLAAIEAADGPPLFVAIDNLDRAIGDHQHALTDLAARMLRNARLYLIFPLRSTSRILLDESKILGFFGKDEMHLSAVNFKAMLRPRFEFAMDGQSLSPVKLPFDKSGLLTFPKLLEDFLASESGDFVLDLAGKNARRLLDFVHRILTSNQLDDVRYITQPEACIAALLMLDEGSFYPELSYLVNLFDNNEPNKVGNELIRFRVLEFLHKGGKVQPTERRFTDHFARLGYSMDRVQEVVATFVGAGLLKTDSGMTADDIRFRGLKSAGAVRPGNSAQYFDVLLHSPWYFICAKRGIHIDELLISHSESGDEFVSDGTFVEILRAEELGERKRIVTWEQRNGRILGKAMDMAQPWAMARDALSSRDRTLRIKEMAAALGVEDPT